VLGALGLGIYFCDTKSRLLAQVPTSGPAQATPTNDINFVAAANAVPVSGNLFASET
jgi:hypothetical protein